MQGLTDESGLFCPHCGAPQILLPEHMRPEPVAVAPALETFSGETTGTAAPPLPRSIDWRVAMPCGALVAVVGAILTAVGIVSAVASLIGFVWVLSGGVIALSIYQKQRPEARMNARLGLRIGAMSGVLTAAALGIALGSAGMVSRFGVHRMAAFDAQIAEATAVMQTQMSAKLAEQKQPQEIQVKVAGLVSSEEVRSGIILGYLAFLGAIVLALSAGGGAFAGMLGTRRQGVKRLL
jgi:hypothetical protein